MQRETNCLRMCGPGSLSVKCGKAPFGPEKLRRSLRTHLSVQMLTIPALGGSRSLTGWGVAETSTIVLLWEIIQSAEVRANLRRKLLSDPELHCVRNPPPPFLPRHRLHPHHSYPHPTIHSSFISLQERAGLPGISTKQHVK